MDYLKIRNWEKWQTYRSDRGQPPWIKVHRRIRLNPEWVELSDAERGQLISMWLLAADKDGLIPSSPQLIQKLCFMSKTPDVNKFIELGFICQNGVNVASEWRQDVVPKEDIKNKEIKNKDTDKNVYGEFENVKLTNEEYSKLKTKFGSTKTQQKIEDLSTYLKSKGKKYKDHYATILAWFRKDGDNGESFVQPKETPTPEYLRDLVAGIGREVK